MARYRLVSSKALSRSSLHFSISVCSSTILSRSSVMVWQSCPRPAPNAAAINSTSLSQRSPS
ncbi:hypothetical protein [Caudoviricetes sp.]|nr:hypothetical protein [Caudoviricetes sp.]UOF79859.1 hypothetical protein [Bacteriophage sp.]